LPLAEAQVAVSTAAATSAGAVAMNRTRLAAVPLLVTALMAGSAWAQNTTGTTGTTTPGGAVTGATPPASSSASGTAAKASPKMARSDSKFMKQAAENSMTEVEASKLALTKASNSQVKSFAQHMVDDHTKANTELMQLAQSKGVALPNDPSMLQKSKMKSMSSMDGADFDKRYVDTVGVKAHEDTVKMFQKASKDAKDPELKAWAAKMLPSLQEHLKMAKDLQAAVKNGDKTAGKS
jgi:putative membrane protein